MFKLFSYIQRFHKMRYLPVCVQKSFNISTHNSSSVDDTRAKWGTTITQTLFTHFNKWWTTHFLWSCFVLLSPRPGAISLCCSLLTVVIWNFIFKLFFFIPNARKRKIPNFIALFPSLKDLVNFSFFFCLCCYFISAYTDGITKTGKIRNRILKRARKGIELKIYRIKIFFYEWKFFISFNKRRHFYIPGTPSEFIVLFLPWRCASWNISKINFSFSLC